MQRAARLPVCLLAALGCLATPAPAQTRAIGWGSQVFDSEKPVGPFVEVTCAILATIARRPDGTLVAWGGNLSGICLVPDPPAGETFVQLTSGGSCGYGLLSNGQGVAWGDNIFGACDVPTPPPGRSYVQMAGGWLYGIGLLDNGHILTWGSDYFGSLAVPPLPVGLSYTAVFAGSCAFAIRSDGSAIGWGTSYPGLTSVPALPAGLTYTQISCGFYHALGLRSDGSIVVWGASYAGEDLVPPLPPGVTYTKVAGGERCSFALRSDGQIAVWGLFAAGILAVPPLPPGLSYTSITDRASQHAAALRSDGQVVVWGYNHECQVGVPPRPPGTEIVELARGDSHTLARLDDGTVRGWGSNWDGQCNIPPGTNVMQVAAGGDRSILLRANGHVEVIGECGPPCMLNGMSDVVWVGASTYASYLILSGGSALALGVGFPRPQGFHYVKLDSNVTHSLGLLNSGGIAAVGPNDYGECDVPFLPPDRHYIDIAAGTGFSLELDSTGRIHAHGLNAEGECDVPPLPPGLQYTSVSAGRWHAVATRSDGELVAWGGDSLGQVSRARIPEGTACVQALAREQETLVLLRRVHVPFCFGDGGSLACPCANDGTEGRGCGNSASARGARLGASGRASLALDALQFRSEGEPPSALSVVLQGSVEVAPASFGDGLRCLGGAVNRMYVHSAVNGTLVAPQAGDLPVSARSAQLGDVLQEGATRFYQVYYRDFDASFCPAPQGSTFNISNGLAVEWAQ